MTAAKAVNDTKRVSHSSSFSGSTAGILLQNDGWDGDVTVKQGKKLYLCGTRMVREDGSGRGKRTPEGLKNE